MKEKIDIFKYCRAGIMGIAALAAFGCAEDVKISSSDQEMTFVESWMQVHYPGTRPTGLGIYILDDQPGDGDVLTDDDVFLFVDYTSTDLQGNVSTTSSEKLSQQTGRYSAANYYGPEVLVNNRGYTQTGIIEMLKGMRVGGTRTAVIPSWLNYIADYETVDEYFKNSSGSNAIYTISLVDKTGDIIEWELDSLKRFSASHLNGIDTTKTGYYYLTLHEPTDTNTFKSDTSYYINYTGRLLNGHVFDTTIEDTAKVHGIWSSDKTYKPMVVKMAENINEITLSSDSYSDGSTTIEGFSYCLSRLRPYEKGICAFYSLIGYGSEGSGSTIPSFAPLSFEIEVVDEP